MFKIIVTLYLFKLVYSYNQFDLNILHYNDFHARFVETSPQGTVCNETKAPCIGGFARLATMVREALEREPQSLLLNAGDSFQGTIWYNILRWNVTQDFMNMLPHDAHAIGNHEFDKGVEGLVPYLKNLKAPVVTANIVDDDEPTMQGLYNKSIIVERGGRKIGIVGVITAETKILSQTGNLIFTDEIEAVKKESKKLHKEGVNIIVVLSHCGIEIDRKIARHGGPYIDIIVGGHSHTLLHNGDDPVNSSFVVRGPYPIVIKKNKRMIPIVQAAAYTQYFGEIKLSFDHAGDLVGWKGNTNFIGKEIKQAPDVIEKINQYLPDIDKISKKRIGTSLVNLNSRCSCNECNLGNLICDSYLHPVQKEADFCVTNNGGLRADIDAGEITYESVMLATPFENKIVLLEMKGQHIIEMLEYSASNFPYLGAHILQVSGLQVWLDLSRPENERVVNVTVRRNKRNRPIYEPLKLDTYYKMVTINYIANGGEGFTVIKENKRNMEVLGFDYDITMDYINSNSPIETKVEGRLNILNSCSYVT